MSNKVLIVTGKQQTGERLQYAFGMRGYQTAVVWNSMQMVEFCRQHTPDLMVIDLDLSGFGIWSALQVTRGVGALVNTPCWAISSTGEPALLERAKSSGFRGVFPAEEDADALVDLIQRSEALYAAPPQMDMAADPVGQDPALNRLREISRDIVEAAHTLHAFVGEFGEDGPELYGYIHNSGTEIRTKLRTTTDFSLHDKEIRHDFRNMIGSVTGFSELILMEGGLSPVASATLTRLREWSREFVHILDLQKAEAVH